MQDFLQQTSYFGFVITIAVYCLALQIKKKTKLSILNPLLITVVILVAILLTFNISYETYNIGAKYISYFLTPTTVCLAIPLYKQVRMLRKNILGILSGILAGVIANAAVVVLLTKVFGMGNELGSSLLAKSITAPIAIGLTDELGGIPSITVFAVVLSGIIGAAIAPTVFKLLHIKDKTAQGLACGTSAHGSGTTTALELGEIQGAMSGLAIIVTGLITTIVAPIVAHLFF